MKFLRDRKDVDPKRIALVGHSEGALVGAHRGQPRRRPRGARPGRGAVRHRRRAGPRTAAVPARQDDPERRRAAGARRPAEADSGGRARDGQEWDDIPAPLQSQADTPWFQSFLAFSPAQVMSKVKQPHPDRAGRARSAGRRRGTPTRWPTLANARKKVPADRVQVTHLDGVNHLLVPAKTGDLEEYPQLAVKTVDRQGREDGDRLAGGRLRNPEVQS